MKSPVAQTMSRVLDSQWEVMARALGEESRDRVLASVLPTPSGNCASLPGCSVSSPVKSGPENMISPASPRC